MRSRPRNFPSLPPVSRIVKVVTGCIISFDRPFARVLPGPHKHTSPDETFYVLDGEILFFLNVESERDGATLLSTLHRNVRFMAPILHSRCTQRQGEIGQGERENVVFEVKATLLRPRSRRDGSSGGEAAIVRLKVKENGFCLVSF